jgi:RNA polymerase sigma-70 factor, ECF subfamily
MATHTRDEELVRLTLAGDAAAFAELVARYRDAALGVAYHYLGNFEDAQDAAQEALVSAYRRLRQLQDPAKFAPWLRRITTNICLGLLRQADRTTPLAEAAEYADPTATLASDAHLERLTTRLNARTALAHLPEKTRLTTTLFYINGYTRQEVANFLEIPVETVRSRLHRAKSKLREEMMAMVSDSLHNGKPGPEFDKKVVAAAMRRGDEASREHWRGRALAHYEEALQMLDKLAPTSEHQQLRIDLLLRKGNALVNTPGELFRYHEEALAIAESLGDKPRQAKMLLELASAYRNAGETGKAVESYLRAQAAYRDLDDRHGQGDCLSRLAVHYLFAGDYASARRDFVETLKITESLSNDFLFFYARASLSLLDELGAEGFAHASGWGAACPILWYQDDETYWHGEWVYCNTGTAPGPFRHSSPFSQISQLGTFLDPKVPVGGSWSGETGSFWPRQLKATVTVLSNTENVAVPAGKFEHCLLTEQVTTEPPEAAAIPEDVRARDRRVILGRRRAWYAPGVGLVQLQVQPAEGEEALVQLHEYSIVEKSQHYLPLAVGNSWTYRWANMPSECDAKDVSRVVAHDGRSWFLEQYAYCLPS